MRRRAGIAEEQAAGKRKNLRYAAFNCEVALKQKIVDLLKYRNVFNNFIAVFVNTCAVCFVSIWYMV